MASPDDRPLYTQLRKGRWYWEPPLRLRRSHGLKVKGLGAEQSVAWSAARLLNRDLAGLDPGAAAPGTVRWLFSQFEASERFAGLAPTTQGDYRWLGKRLSAVVLGGQELGRFPARSVRPRHADAIYRLLVKQGGATAAHYACRYARRVWKWAGRRELVDVSPNPWSGMELPTIKARTQRWTRAQVLAVVAKAVEMDRASIGLAILLAYEMGHRQGDVLSLTWTALDRGERSTSKTGAVVPMVPAAYPELAEVLRVVKEGRGEKPSTHVVVCEMTRRPWQADTFRHQFRLVADAAGLPAELQFRDLRATAATELADAGADVLELSTHTGHLTTQMARRYARRTTAQFEAAAKKRTTAREQGRGD